MFIVIRVNSNIKEPNKKHKTLITDIKVTFLEQLITTGKYYE